MKIKGNHPLAEVIAKSLFSIETVGNNSDQQKKYIQRMVNRSCIKAVEWYQKDIEINYNTEDFLMCAMELSLDFEGLQDLLKMYNAEKDMREKQEILGDIYDMVQEILKGLEK